MKSGKAKATPGKLVKKDQKLRPSKKIFPNQNLRMVTATEASKKFGTLLDDVVLGKQAIGLTFHGRVRAVVLRHDQFQALLKSMNPAKDSP